MKKITLFAILISFSLLLNAQTSFSHSIGGGIVGVGPNFTVPTLMYSPRLNIKSIGENSTISVGTHFGLGFNLESSNSRTGGSSGNSFININLPVLAEYNFGRGSSPDNEDGFGFFIGAGGGLNYAAVSGGAASSYGPMGNAGVKFQIANYDLGLRGGYMLDLSSNKLNVWVVNLLYNL
jgi:hypothetical protein